MLGTRTRGGRMIGADESTELWRHPNPSSDESCFSLATYLFFFTNTLKRILYNFKTEMADNWVETANLSDIYLSSMVYLSSLVFLSSLVLLSSLVFVSHMVFVRYMVFVSSTVYLSCIWHS